MIPNVKLDLLKETQVSGLEQLRVLDKIGTKMAPTDFAILCGAYASKCNYVDSKESLEDRRAGEYFIKGQFRDFILIDEYGSRTCYTDSSRQICIRPTLPFSEIRDICYHIKKDENGKIVFVKCGCYPEKSVIRKLERKLDDKFNQGLLKKVDYITTNSPNYGHYDKRFLATKQYIYEEQEKRYARVLANPIDTTVTLSNRRRKPYRTGDYVWIECTPILLGVDEEMDIAFPIKGIISGIPLINGSNWKDNDLYRFMNTYLLRDMFSIYEEKITKENNINNIDKLKVLKKR